MYWQTAGKDVPSCGGMSVPELRESAARSLKRLLTLSGVQGSVVRSGAEALSLVYTRLLLTLDENPSLELESDVVLPIVSALLENDNAYGRGHPSCTMGQISRIVNAAGRIEVDGRRGRRRPGPGGCHAASGAR